MRMIWGITPCCVLRRFVAQIPTLRSGEKELTAALQDGLTVGGRPVRFIGFCTPSFRL